MAGYSKPEMKQWLSDLVLEVNKTLPDWQVEIDTSVWASCTPQGLSLQLKRTVGDYYKVIHLGVILWGQLDTAMRFSWVDRVYRGVVTPPKESLDYLLLNSSDSIDDLVE